MILILLVFAIQITIPKIIDLNKYQEQIYNKIKNITDRNISFGNISFSIFRGLSIRIYNVTIKEDDGESDFINIPSLGFRIKVLPLLEKKIEVESIILDSPTFYIKKYDEQTFNFNTFLKQKISELDDEKIPDILTTTLLKKLIIHGGRGYLFDKGKDDLLYIKDINLIVENLSLKGPIDVEVSFKIPSDTQPFYSPSSLVLFKGHVSDIPLDLNPYETYLDLILDIKYFNPVLFQKHYKEYVPFESIKGLLNFSGSLKGKLASTIQSKGKLELFKINLIYSEAYFRPVKIKYGRLEYQLVFDKKDIELKDFTLRLDNLSIRGGVSLKNYRDYNKMEISGKASTPKIPIAYAKMLAPTKAFLRVRSGRYLSPFIEDLVDGNLKNATCTVNGKIKNFRNKQHLDPDMISGRAEVDNVRLKINEQSAPAVLVTGEWILKHRHIYFNSFTGYYGRSVFQHLASKFTDIGIDTTYSMEIKGLVGADNAIDILTWDTFDALPFLNNFIAKGFIKTDINFIIPVKHKQDFSLTGIAEPLNIRFSLKGDWLDFNRFSQNTVFTGDGLIINEGNFFLGSSPVKLSISLTNWYKPNVSFELFSDYFDFKNVFDEHLMKRFRFHKPKISPASHKRSKSSMEFPEDPILRWSINGDFNLAKGRLGKVPFRKMKSTLRLKNGQLELKPTKFESCKGKILIPRFNIKVNRKERGNFELAGKINQIDLATYLLYSKLSKDIATGKMDLDILVNGNLKSSYHLRRSLSGVIRFDLKNGIFPRLKKYTPLFSYLQLKAPQKDIQGFPFEQTIGSVSLLKGTMGFNNMVVKSDIVNITVEGNVFLPSETMDLVVGIHFSEPFDVVFDYLPIVGTIVAGPDQELLTTYFTVKGPTDDPKVGISPVYSWKQGAKKALDTLTGN